MTGTQIDEKGTLGASSCDVAKLIAEVRTERHVTLRDFAASLDVAHQAVVQWERGIAEPSDERLASWAKDERAWVQKLAIDILTARFRAQLIALLPSPITA